MLMIPSLFAIIISLLIFIVSYILPSKVLKLKWLHKLLAKPLKYLAASKNLLKLGYGLAFLSFFSLSLLSMMISAQGQSLLMSNVSFSAIIIFFTLSFSPMLFLHRLAKKALNPLEANEDQLKEYFRLNEFFSLLNHFSVDSDFRDFILRTKPKLKQEILSSDLKTLLLHNVSLDLENYSLHFTNARNDTTVQFEPEELRIEIKEDTLEPKVELISYKKLKLSDYGFLKLELENFINILSFYQTEYVKSSESHISEVIEGLNKTSISNKINDNFEGHPELKEKLSKMLAEKQKEKELKD
jgi:hypothetical protein